jgi:hypothetical protein
MSSSDPRIIHFWDLRRPVYRRVYKYKLERPYEMATNITPPRRLAVGGEWVVLETSGHLFIKANYAWDGPSGPTFDSHDFMRGSLVHDALYQLMREGMLDRRHRDTADRLLEALCREDGMHPIKAAQVYFIVKNFGKNRAWPHPLPPLRRAPER